MENKKVFSRIGFGLALILFLGQISSTILSTSFPTIFKGSIGGILSNYVGMYLVGLPILFLIIKNIPQKMMEKKESVSLKEMLQAYVLSLAGMYLVNLGFTMIMQYLTNSDSNIIGEVISQMPILQMTLLVVIFAPIIEEFIFRKLLYQLLAPFGVKTYIFTSALVFGLFHLNLSQSLYAFWLGLILAGLFYKTGSILYPIMLHMMINFTGSIVPLLLGQNSSAVIILIIWMFLMIILGIIFLLSFRKKIKKKLPQKIAQQKIPFKIIFLNPGMIVYVLLCTLIIAFVLIVQLTL